MKKPFSEQTHYEVLEIATDALALEIRHAYKRAMALYEDSAIASYSFFSEKERREILDCIEESYLTLINPETRSAYDRKLRELGILLEQDQDEGKGREPVALYEFQRSSGYDSSPNRRSEVLKSLAAENPVVQERLARAGLAGADLKMIRTALQVTLEEISHQTNIRIDVLRSVEAGNREQLPPRVYLKGFLKAYARCLALDEQVVATAYLLWLEKGEPPAPQQD